MHNDISNKGFQILYFDRDPNQQEELKKRLTPRGHTVTGFDSENSAVKFLEANSSDFILCRPDNPESDGLELLRKFREKQISLPFVLIVDKVSVELARQAVQLGAYHFLPKSFDVDNFEALMFQAIENSKLQKQQLVIDLKRANDFLKDTQTQLAQSEKMASLGSLVAGIAHEINTPVGAISSMHDSLSRGLKKLREEIACACFKEEDQKRFEGLLNIVEEANRVIYSGAERVGTIVKRLRSFARLDEAELKTANIHEGIEDTLTLVQHELKHDIEVIKNFGKVPAIRCFPGQLNQVFLNLIVNARQAIKGKGKITITTHSANKEVIINISDTGSGISKEHLSRVFDPGFTTKGVGVGTGLGLSICYQIIKRHRGNITVKSEPGKGTTFTIVLPTNLNELPGKS